MKKWVRTLIASLFLLAIWQLMHLMTKGLGVPSVIETFKNTFSLFSTLLSHLWISFLRLSIGLLIAMVLGSLIGYLMSKYAVLDEFLSPLVYLLSPLPKVAFLPIMMVLLGISENARIGILIFVVIFQFILGIRDALKAMPEAMVLTICSLDLSRKTTIKDVIIPYCLPSLFTSFRQAFGMSLAVLFFLETFVNQKGIGYFIMNRWGMVNYPDMFSGILILSIFGYLIYLLIDKVEARCVKGQ